MDKVILTVSRPFGGARIANGRAFADLWSDGVVLATAGSLDQPEIAGELFTFRGQLTRARLTSRPSWRLVEAGGTWVDNYPTRKAALEAAIAKVTLDAFRELNRVEAAR